LGIHITLASYVVTYGRVTTNARQLEELEKVAVVKFEQLNINAG
jgi:hypothetical protein